MVFGVKKKKKGSAVKVAGANIHSDWFKMQKGMICVL